MESVSVIHSKVCKSRIEDKGRIEVELQTLSLVCTRDIIPIPSLEVDPMSLEEPPISPRDPPRDTPFT